MKRSYLAAIFLGVFLATFSGLGEEVEGINFSGLDPVQVATLAKQGSLLIVKFKPDGKLKEIVAATVVNAAPDKVWATIQDYDNYSKFMPQTTSMRIVSKPAPNQVLTQQDIQVEIYVLKVKLAYQMLQKLEPNKKIRFTYVSGDLPGTFGGYDLVEVPGKNQTLLFYTLYSNLTALPWPIGPIMNSQPDFLTSVNVSTGSMVVKAVKEETERKLAAGK
jgi:hypothetical protein